MPITTFYVSSDVFRPKPTVLAQIKNGKVIESHLTIPSAKNVHILLIDYSCVSKPDFRFEKLLKLSSIDLPLLHKRCKLSLLELFCFDSAPTVRTDLITVDI